MNQVKADKEMIAEMQSLLEQESRKPANKRDYKMIEQLSAAIYEATSTDDLSVIAEKNINQLAAQSAEKSRKLRQSRWMRPAVTLAACVVICLCLNAWTIHTFGQNLPKTIYQITQGAISIRPSDLDPAIIRLESSADDPYGIRTECEKLGFSPLTPAYIPTDMKLQDLTSNDAPIKRVTFTYKSSKHNNLQLHYKYAVDQQVYESIDFGFPSDHYQIHEETIGGKTVLISWEDEVFHAAFCDSDAHIVYHMSSNYIGYDESYRVLCSYFE